MKDESLPHGSIIEVMDLSELLINVIASACSASVEEIRTLIAGLNEKETLAQLRDEFRRVALQLGERCQVYDAVLIDEIQDFDRITPPLLAVIHRGTERFMVGDVAQRIHQEVPMLHHLDIEEQSARVPGSYTMYRCPAGIARVAHGFARDDRLLASELLRHGYGETTRFRGVSKALPEFRHANSSAELFPLLCDRLKRHHEDGVPWEQVMVIDNEEPLQQARRQQMPRHPRLDWSLNHFGVMP